jgi:uncharacterized protein YndB with AHSA1/START domain
VTLGSAGNARVEVTTVIRAPRETVFDAWLTPDRLVHFLCAGDTRVAAIEVDARVGGEFHLVMANERGRYDHRGRYLEIERPSRLRFTWISAATDGAETEVTVTFDDADSGTRVTLVHVGLRDPRAAERHQSGWQSILDKAGAAVADRV